MTTRSPRAARRRAPWTRLLLLALCAAFATGGTFTCNGSNHDDDPRPASR